MGIETKSQLLLGSNMQYTSAKTVRIRIKLSTYKVVKFCNYKHEIFLMVCLILKKKVNPIFD